MRLRDFLQEANQQLERNNLFRNIEDKVISSNELCFSGNDYLGLAKENYSQRGHYSGSTGSRLTTGTHQIHLDLEALLARWKKSEAAILFSSGYMANFGTIAALLDSRDIVYVDELAHACIYDGIRLSKCRKNIFRHNDVQHLSELMSKSRSDFSKAFIITDSVFSMDGDRAPLSQISELASSYEASLYVDEAHGSGVLGKTGAGLVEELIDKSQLRIGDVEIQMGTFSKAIGLEAAYIVGSTELIKYLRNKARSFIYSTAPSPWIMQEAYERILRLSRGDFRDRQNKLSDNIQYFRQALENNSIPVYPEPNSEASPKAYNDMTAIFAIFLGDLERTLKVAEDLRKKSIFVTAIRPPTVSEPRLRISMSSQHSFDQIELLTKEICANI